MVGDFDVSPDQVLNEKTPSYTQSVLKGGKCMKLLGSHLYKGVVMLTTSIKQCEHNTIVKLGGRRVRIGGGKKIGSRKVKPAMRVTV